MGKEAAERFIALLAGDEDLRKRVAGSQLGALVQLAAARGFEFTADELQEIAASLVKLETGELSDAELAGVAGGVMSAAAPGVSSLEVMRVAAGIRDLGSQSPSIIVTYGAGIAGPQSRE